MLLSAEDRLSRARIVLERRGLAAEDLLPRAVAESWTRCLALGLDPQRPPPLAAVEQAALERARAQADLVRRLALGEMESLYHQIAGTNFMIAFAAPDGLLLDTICDSTFQDAARATSIRPGTLWSEARCGTNALGTVVQTGAAATVHGGEHFFRSHTGLTCIAVPVLAADGSLAGVLDASSDCRSRQQHTQALVTMAATQIENGLFRESHGGQVIIAFHSRAEYLHTLSAGLLAVDADGAVLGANARARFLLAGLPVHRGRRLEDVFRTDIGRLLRGEGDRQRLEDRVGSVFAARVETPPRPRPVAVPRLGFVAEDPAVAAVLTQVEAAARRRLPILIRGATGTGKEHLARHAHRASGRAGAFVPVNCAGLPDTLVEAEFFGHAEGAFTGARRGGAPGLAVEADGGTLFLDEIGDMKLALQAVLLRLLDDWTVRPVGGGRRRQVDVLLVAATNVDLERAVAEGRFRADLLYRINMVDVSLPPLCARRDFAQVAERLLAEVAPRARLLPEAASLLGRRPWPGNMRQLRSELTRLTLVDPGRVIDAEAVGLGDAIAVPPAPRDLRTLLAQQVRTTHRDVGGNVAETARRLGVSRNTVYRALGRSV
jgi:transcriptional regulator of acetoin/glycerol metabolism